MPSGLTPDDVDELLHELARRLSDRGTAATIRVVGGAALAVRNYRTTTTFDVDAVFDPKEQVLAVAAELAGERNLPPDWLNSDAGAYIPFVGPQAWVQLFRDGDVRVYTASAKLLLGMKLKANRGRRDADDIKTLLAVCRVRTVEQAQRIYEHYHPQEVLSPAVTARIQTYLKLKTDPSGSI